MVQAKKYILSQLKKAFEAGAKTESTYVGGGNSVEKKVYSTFEDYAKAEKIDEEEDGEGGNSVEKKVYSTFEDYAKAEKIDEEEDGE